MCIYIFINSTLLFNKNKGTNKVAFSKDHKDKKLKLRTVSISDKAYLEFFLLHKVCFFMRSSEAARRRKGASTTCSYFLGINRTNIVTRLLCFPVNLNMLCQ